MEALSTLHEGFGQTIRDRLANAHDVPYPIEQMAAEFVVEATETIVDDMHVLLDDYHEAADSRSLNVTLDYLVANLPPSMRFVDPEPLRTRVRGRQAQAGRTVRRRRYRGASFRPG